MLEESTTRVDIAPTLIALPDHVEQRGSLVPIDLGALPFSPRRVFAVRDVPPGTTRGGHAHSTGQQFLVCLSGEVEVEWHNGTRSGTVRLGDAGTGLLIPAPVWSSQTYLTPDAVLLVLASEPYDPASYTE
jgi:dTDP-4-dehydrorhamnose 3,5-epimerase-like enzyme